METKNQVKRYKYKEACTDKLILSPFSDLKELISQNRYKTKTNLYLLWSLLIQNMKLQKFIAQEDLYFKYQAFFSIYGFYIINPASMDCLLGQIYMKRLSSSYETLFQKISLFQSVLHWLILEKKINCCCFNWKNISS